MLKTIQFHVQGVAPLLMHNSDMANPLNRWAKLIKEISGKRKKTDSDYKTMSDYEFQGGIYLDENGNPAIPGELIEATLVAAAKKQKKGTDTKIGLYSDGVWPLLYSGPKTIQKLLENDAFRDTRMVRVGQAKVLRTRPVFNHWELKFDITYDDEILNQSDITSFAQVAGTQCGIGDYRPKYGRFKILSAIEMSAA